MSRDPFFSCILTESNDMEAYATAYNLEHAWRQWRLESCVERNGGHAWILEGDHPDDGSGVALHCAHDCGGDLNDICPDGIDLIGGDLHGIQIDAGNHDSPHPFVCPVDVEFDAWSYETPDGREYDAAIEVTPTGPVTSEWSTS